MINNASTWPLDLRLVQFSRYPEDHWTLADACQGGAYPGRKRTGKTSASGRLFARKYLQAGFGGLVLCFKTDEADLWRQYLKGAGREADSRFFGASEDFRFNFLDYEARSSGVDFVDSRGRRMDSFRHRAVDLGGYLGSLLAWRRELSGLGRAGHLAGENTVSSRRNAFPNYAYSKLLCQANVAPRFHLFPNRKCTLETNGKDWKQKARNLSNCFHSAADLAQSVRGDA